MTGKKAIIILFSILIFCLLLSLALYIITLNLKIKYMESQKLNTVETIIFTRTIQKANNTIQKAAIAMQEMNEMGKEVDARRIHQKRQLFEFDKWVIKTKTINGIKRDVWEIDIQYGYRMLQQRLAEEGCIYLDFKGVY